MKAKKWIVIGATILVVALGAMAMTGMMPGGGAPGGGGGAPGGGRPGGNSDESDRADQKTVVETASPTLGSIVVTGSYVGTVEPGQQVTVYPKTSGELTAVNFGVGDTVQAGDVLFRVDSTSLQLDIAQTQANISAAEAKAQLNLEIAQTDYENYSNNAEDGLNSTLLQAEANIKSAEVALQQANTSYRNARQSYLDYINGDTFEDYSDTQAQTLRTARTNAELAVESAQLQLENAQATLEATRKQVEEQQASAENSIRSAELGADMSSEYISLQKLQNNLNDYTVYAPIGGVIEQRNIEPYNTVSTATAAFVISNKDLYTVSFQVTEATLNNMEIGDSIELEKNEQTWHGTLSEKSTMVESSSGLYTVKATVENPPFEMHTGSTIKLYASTQNVENEIVIPIDAVYYDNGTPYVYVFENNSAKKVEIETGINNADSIQVKSGLGLSDEVIVTWSASLFDGAEVYLPGTVPETDEADDVAQTDREEMQGPPEGADTPENFPGEDGQDARPAPGTDSEGGDSGPRDDAEEDAA